MTKAGNRVRIKMRSTESPFTDITMKNKRNNPDRLEMRKYDPVLKKHVLFKETR